MSYLTQGRKEHGWFGDGRADAAAKTRGTGGTAGGVGAIAAVAPAAPGPSAADPHEANVEDLARVIASEARGTSPTEQTMVGQVLMNRIDRAPPGWTVKQVWSAFSHRRAPIDSERALARRIIDGTEPDVSKGATHFDFPDAMPKAGEPTKGKDVSGGLEWSTSPKGRQINNYRPGFATRYPSVTIPGVDSRNFRVYQQSGTGHVY